MKQKVKFNNNSYNIVPPQQCPHCQKGIKPEIIKSFSYDYYTSKRGMIAYQCSLCQQIFFVEYPLENYSGCDEDILGFIQIIGGNKIEKEFSPVIKEVSENFVKIFNEAFTAEQSNCKDIAGIGYRRAFEFLIKDFVIKYNPDNKENIETMNLATCINNYFPNGSTKDILERTTWIGNDFAHYKDKHPEYSIEDLKKLISFSVLAIETEIETCSYIQNIERK